MTGGQQRRRSEEAAHQGAGPEADQLRAIFELAGVGMAQADPYTQRFLRVNRRLAEMTGYSQPELLALSAAELTHPEDRGLNEAEWARTLRGEVPRFAVEKRYVRKDGAAIWVGVVATILRDPQGNPVSTVATVQDISERRAVEERLRESEGRARALVENLPGGAAFVVDHDLRYRLAEGQALATAGVRPADLVGRTPWETLPPELAESYAAHYRRALAGQTFELEHLYHGRTYLTRGVPLRTPEGQVYAALAVSYDITERQQAEERVRDSDAKYRALFNSIDEGFCVFELVYDGDRAVDYRFVEVNPVFERQTGLRGVVGRLGSEAAQGTEGHWLDFCDQVARTGQGRRVEEFHRTTGRWYSTYASRLGGAGSRRVCTVFTDITERKRYERNLAFLAEVSESLAPLATPEGVLRQVGERLAAHLGLSRCNFSEVELEADRISVLYDWRRDPEAPSLLGEHKISTFLSPPARQRYAAGLLTVVQDVRTDPNISAPPELMDALRVRSVVDAPHLEQGRWRFLISAARAEPDTWSDDEVGLIRELAARVYARLERARAEEALRHSEAELRLIADSLPSLISYVDKDERYRFVNAGYEGWFGAPRQEIVGRTMAELLGAAYPAVRDKIRRALAGERVSFEDTLDYPQGRRSVLVQYVPDARPGDGVPGFYALITDISERARAEELLRESRNRLALALEAERQARSRAERLQAVSAALSSARSAAEVYRAALEDGAAAMGAVGGALYGLEGDRLRLAGLSGIPEGLVEPYRDLALSAQTPAAHAVREGRAVWLGSRAEYAAAYPGLEADIRALGSEAVVSLPVLHGGRAVGALSFTFAGARAFDEEERRFLLTLVGLVAQALERARAEERLREGEERLRMALESGRLGVWDWDLGSGQQHWSPEMSEIFGLPHREVRPAADFFGRVHPDDLPLIRGRAEEAARQGRDFVEDEFRILPPGGERWVSSRARLHRDPGGTPVRMTGVNLDITERKRAERDRAWLAAIVESSTDAVVSFDLEGRVLSWNPAAERMLGYSAAEAVGGGLERLVPPGLEAEGAEVLRQVRGGRHVVQLETVRLRKGGERAEVSITASPIRDAAGGVIAGTAIIQDIGGRRRTERALGESDRRYRELVAQVRDYAIFSTDPQGRVTTWNEGCQAVLGYRREEFAGLDSRLLFTPEDRRAGVPEAELETAARWGSSSDDRWMLRNGGGRFWASGVTSALRDASGGLVGFTKVMRDRTEARQAEEALRASAEAQRRFAADASHELRAPLGSVLGNLEVIRRYPQMPSEDRHQALAEAHAEATHMSRLISDLLELARGDSGQRVRRQTVQLDYLLEVVLRQAAKLTRGHRLEQALQPVTLSGDPDRLKELALILLDNALKYTPPGGLVRVELEADADHATLRVTDDGPGISPEDMPHVFERFYRADKARSRTHAFSERDPGGTGLGLSIARQIAEAHGGEITLKSEPGRGTVATVRLPLSPA